LDPGALDELRQTAALATANGATELPAFVSINIEAPSTTLNRAPALCNRLE
jgi:hypothetical protein